MQFILFDCVCQNKNWDVGSLVKWVGKVDKVVFMDVIYIYIYIFYIHECECSCSYGTKKRKNSFDNYCYWDWI